MSDGYPIPARDSLTGTAYPMRMGRWIDRRLGGRLRSGLTTQEGMLGHTLDTSHDLLIVLGKGRAP